MISNLLTISIIFNGENNKHLFKMIDTLQSQSACNILIYGSGIKISNSLKNYFLSKKVTFIFDYEIKTLGYGINSIVSKVNTPWFLVLDNDLEISDFFIKNIEKILNLLDNQNVGAIQSLLKPVNDNNPWSHYECLGDLMSYLSDRTDSYDWFKKKSLDINTVRNIKVLQGGARIFNTDLFRKIGLARDIQGGIDRDLGVRIINAGYVIRFDPLFSVSHYYPESLFGVIKRKFKHSKGSVRTRKTHSNFFKDSYLIRIKMLKSCLFPPLLFCDSIWGRIYYFFTMLTFSFGLIWHRKINK